MKKQPVIATSLMFIVLSLGSIFCSTISGSGNSISSTLQAIHCTQTALVEENVQATQLALGIPTSTLLPTETLPREGASPTTPATEAAACSKASDPFWHWQAGIYDEYDFYFISPTEGFLVGEPDSILHTTDGGRTWSAVPIPSDQKINKIVFANPNNGWMAGDNGTILNTVDGGKHWQAQTTNTEANLEALEFVNANTGWAAGASGTVLYTTDGGANWSAATSNTQINITDMSFINSKEGYFVGSSEVIGGVYHTVDGGVTWTQIFSQFDMTVPIGIYASPDGTVWIVGGWVDNSIWKVTGGSYSTVLNFTPSSEAYLHDIYFTDPQHGYAYGYSGVFITTDGGNNWSQMPQEYENSLEWDMQFFSASNSILIGNSNGAVTIKNTSDGGNTWDTISKADYEIGNWMLIKQMDFLEPSSGWVLEKNSDKQDVILMTHDGGQSWNEASVPSGASAIQFVDASRGWLVGDTGLVARTDDGGNNWKIESIPFPGAWDALSFVDRNHGWVISSASGNNTCEQSDYDNPGHLTVFHTNDGGDSWQGPTCVEVPEHGSYYDYHAEMQFVNPTTGWIVANGGLVLKTTDSGTTWVSENSGVAVDLSSVFLLNDHSGWITGKNGVLLSTTDGGSTWKQQRIGDRVLNEVRFIDADHGWIASDSEILQSNDGGNSWNTIVSTYSMVFPVDIDHIWAASTARISSFSPICYP